MIVRNCAGKSAPSNDSYTIKSPLQTMPSTSKTHARQLGRLMCTVTEQILWPGVADFHLAGPGKGVLVCRVGSGQATYHRFDPANGQHQITYGARMIQAKHQPETASGWLSAREIQQRSYFRGRLSALNLLSHTCCHEFAHLLQHDAGQRYRGSVHNRHFYRILDELHASGQAEASRRALSDLAREQGLTLADERFDIPEPSNNREAWRVGDEVLFHTGRHQVRGEVLRVNRKTCTISGIGNFKGIRYRVPVQLLKQVGVQ